MKGFLLASAVWMGGAFALLLWAQASVDAMHRSAAEIAARSMRVEPPPVVDAGAESGAALAVALDRARVRPGDLIDLELRRREIMRRLRILWLILTLTPPLIAAWWVVRPNRSTPVATPPNPSG